MKLVDKVKLKIAYEIGEGEYKKVKSKTYNSIDIEATDNGLKQVGEAFLTVVDGDSKTIHRIEESTLS